jgi:Domain of unknown function (DUF4337)
MNPEELSEQTEHAERAGQKAIGLTTAITAVLLAVSTLLGHRAHTEEIKLQTKVNDQWSFYQAKHQRAHDYAKDAEKEFAAGHHDIAVEFFKVSLDEECGSPAEKGCNIPRSKAPLLQQLAAEVKEPGAKTQTEGSAPPAESNNSHQASAEHEKPKEGAPAREGAVKIQEKAREMEQETETITRRADHFDTSELFLEVSIVLCSISLLAENKAYWRMSFVTTAIGIAVAIYGFVAR